MFISAKANKKLGVGFPYEIRLQRGPEIRNRCRH